MEQEFQLKYFCGYDKFEMAFMNAEERNWILKRANEEAKKQQEANTPSPKGYKGTQFK
jgi:hypothetical protein